MRLARPVIACASTPPYTVKSVPPAVSRRDVLLRKAERLRIRLAIHMVGMDDCCEELCSELAKVREEIRQINVDPLTYDICIQEPWLQECKCYDH